MAAFTPTDIITRLSAVTLTGNTGGQVALASTLTANLRAAVAALDALNQNSAIYAWTTGQPWVQVQGYQSAFEESDRLTRTTIICVPPSPALVATVNSTFGITGSGQAPAALAFDTSAASFALLTNRASVALSVAGAPGAVSNTGVSVAVLSALVSAALASVTAIWATRPNTTGAQDAAFTAANAGVANAMAVALGFLSSLGFS